MKAFEYEERRFEVVEEDEFRPIDSHASPIGWRIHLPSRAPIELKKQILFHEAAEIAINSHYVALLWELKEFGLRGIYYRIKYIRDYTVIIPALTIGFFMYLLIKGDYLGIWVFGFLLGFVVFLGLLADNVPSAILTILREKSARRFPKFILSKYFGGVEGEN